MISRYQNNLGNEILAMAYLQPLLRGPFLPFTNSSVDPTNLVCLLNEITINRRKKILEFGSGISTILIARLIHQNNLDATIFSIDHDIDWMEFVQTNLTNEKLDHFAHLCHAPLKPCSLSFNNNLWYDHTLLDFAKQGEFDMIIVDGPPAWEKNKELARYPALPIVFNNLSQNFAIYLDDIDREGEQRIIEKWETEYQLAFVALTPTLACCHRGKAFNPAIEFFEY